MDSALPTGYFTLTSLSTSSSRLDFSSSATVRLISQFSFRCGSASCGVEIVVPAVVSKPTYPDITRDDNGYTIRSSGDITRVYSSRGQYSCVWQQKFENTSSTSIPMTTLILHPDPSNSTNTQDRFGNCSFSETLSSRTGTYTYIVTVSPGNIQRSSDSILISRPSQPVITCPRDYVLENTDINCTCSTGNIGQPGGRLRWYTGTNGDFNTEVVGGSYDVNSVTMTWPVTRSDHNVRGFRCVNNWTVNITAQSDYTITVAYQPSNTGFSINNTDSLTVNESEAVTFDCQSRGRPAPGLQLKQVEGDVIVSEDGGTPRPSSETSRMSHTIYTRCKNTGVYTCIASNGFGNDLQSSVRLYVNCRPRGTTKVQDPPEVTFVDTSVSVVFHMEAFPSPTVFNFTYLGHTPTVNSSGPVPDGVIFNVTCSKTHAEYAMKCNVSVEDVKNESAAGFYAFIASNSFGSEKFVFLVKVDNQKADPSDMHSSTSSVGGIIGGVVASVVVIVVVGVVVFVFRRRIFGDKTYTKPNRSQQETSPYTDLSMNTLEHSQAQANETRTYSNSSQSGTAPPDYQNVTSLDNSGTGNTYEGLVTSDIGLASPYEQFNVAHTEASQEAVYQNSERENDESTRGYVNSK